MLTRFSCIAVMALMLSSRLDAQDLGSLDKRPGATSRIAWPGLESSIEVYLPESWKPERKWPVLFYYHGTNGSSSVELPKAYSGGDGFVLVGMDYSIRGPIESSKTATFYEEVVGRFRDVRDWLAVEVGVDLGRVYVGGFSKGGWTAAYFADRHPELIAGALILGAGVNPYNLDARDLPRIGKGTSIYVGVGQVDTNYAVSLQASDHYGKRGADVVFEVYDGLGHQPAMEPRSEYLCQWFLIEGHQEEAGIVQAAFERWLNALDVKLENEPDPLRAYLVLERAGRAPFSRFLSDEQKRRYSSRLAKLRLDDSVKSEWEQRVRYERIRDREAKGGFRLNVWKSIIVDYADLYKREPTSFFAKRAGLDAVRVLRSIEEAVRRRERENGDKEDFLTNQQVLV